MTDQYNTIAKKERRKMLSQGKIHPMPPVDIAE
jgi:hypothetical protein